MANWKGVFASVFGDVHKELSEKESDVEMKAFEAESERIAGELSGKAAKILELEASVGQLTSANEELKKKYDAATAQVSEMAEELKKFGETKEAREAYADEHTRLAGWFDAEKAKKEEKGEDKNTGAKSAEENKVDRRAELKEQYPKFFGK